MKILMMLVLMLSFQVKAETISAEDFGKLTKLDGTPFQAGHNRVLMYFWATWCPDCKEKLEKEFPRFQLPADTQLITVNTDKELKRAQHYVEKEKIGIAVIRDTEKLLAQKLKVYSVPFWAVLQKEAHGSWKIVDSEAGGNLEKAKAALKVVR